MQQIYAFLLRIPDTFYPSYAGEILRCQERFGSEDYCVNIVVYRSLYHLAGSLLIIFALLWLWKWTKSKLLIFSILALVILWVLFQELYLHPQYYGQHFFKGLIDMIVWILPLLCFSWYIKKSYD